MIKDAVLFRLDRALSYDGMLSHLQQTRSEPRYSEAVVVRFPSTTSTALPSNGSSAGQF